MAQVLSTFQQLEQSRFEAFRRSTFRGDAVADFVALCLEEENKRRTAGRCLCKQFLGASGYGVLVPAHVEAALEHIDSGNRMKKKPVLEDMVAHHCAEEITIVVSTLAKAYAQRLVTAARRLASTEHPNDNGVLAPLRPHHFIEAQRHRARAGLDPGFFLSPPPKWSTSSSAASAAIGQDDEYKVRFDAALAAQDEYDRIKAKKKGEEEQKESKEA
mmetsp:Transcript_28789/g.44224  ORF Transcript_28789/g.44224 Transcript_28789/m.44224 type:complete len:216 (-) Transcript_28789:46-693(-)